MLSEHERLDNLIQTVQTNLKKLPPGKLIVAHNGKHCKWYQSDGHTKSYIPKSHQYLAEQLAAKRYLSLRLEELSHEKSAIEFYLRHHLSATEKSELLLTDNSPYHELLIPYFTPKSQELADWMNSIYERNPKFPEQLIHKGSSGNLLRSKSEAIIDMLLHVNKIPFRYECALQLDETTIYPDFTIRHPITGATYYWEHFGLMDDPSYYKNVYSKLQLYTSHGIIPSIQLITTYETKNSPLSSELVEKIVEHYFL